jgi:hypothetical protein
VVGGFNTNVRYRGRVYHVQTEDSGPASSRAIVTLLYEGGVILFSKKTKHAGNSQEGPRAVREIMESQHAEMVRALKGGELEAEIGARAAVSGARAAAPAAASEAAAPAPEPAAPAAEEAFGQGSVTEVPLDQLVLTYLGVR